MACFVVRARRALLGSVIAVACCVGLAVSPNPVGAYYDEHLCGVNGTVLNSGERCPGISPNHSWSQITGYRVGANSNMCVQVISGTTNNQIFYRCSYYDTVIAIGSSDLANGSQLTRAYNKNANCCLAVKERRYLYARTP